MRTILRSLIRNDEGATNALFALGAISTLRINL